MSTKKASPVMTQAAIQRCVKESIVQALVIERTTVNVVAAETGRSTVDAATARGSGVYACIYKDFKNDGLTKFKGTEGATTMIR